MPSPQLTEIEQKFLSEFKNGSDIDWFRKKDHHKYIEYSQINKLNLDKEFKKFITSGLLRIADPAELIADSMTLPELKKACAHYGLKTSGKKIDLAYNLAQAEPNYGIFLKKHKNIYFPTDEGYSIIDSYLQKQDIEKEMKKNAVYSFLDSIIRGGGALNGPAVDRDFLIPNGQDVIHVYVTKDDNIFLRFLYYSFPRFLNGLNPDYVDIIRQTLGADRLLGTNSIRKYETFDTNIPGLKLGNAMIVMSSYCYSQRSLTYYRSEPIYKAIKITTGNVQSLCPSCRNLLDQIFPINGMIPEIPNPVCMNRMRPCVLDYYPLLEIDEPKKKGLFGLFK